VRQAPTEIQLGKKASKEKSYAYAAKSEKKIYSRIEVQLGLYNLTRVDGKGFPKRKEEPPNEESGY